MRCIRILQLFMMKFTIKNFFLVFVLDIPCYLHASKTSRDHQSSGTLPCNFLWSLPWKCLIVKQQILLLSFLFKNQKTKGLIPGLPPTMLSNNTRRMLPLVKNCVSTLEKKGKVIWKNYLNNFKKLDHACTWSGTGQLNTLVQLSVLKAIQMVLEKQQLHRQSKFHKNYVPTTTWCSNGPAA